MTMTLIDDGTLDTVFRCDDCGEELRYSQDWRADFFEPDSYDDGVSFSEDVAFSAMLKEAAEEHAEECRGHSLPEEG